MNSTPQATKDKVPKQKIPEQGVKIKKDKAITGAEESPTKHKKVKKSTQNECALLHTLPRNIEEQQELFFANDCAINPQFEYDNYEATLRFMKYYGEPSTAYIPIAEKILESFLATFKSESEYLATEGDIVS